MPFFRIKVDQNELQRAIGQLSAWEGRKRKAVEEALYKGVVSVRKGAASRVSARTKRLRKSIKCKFNADRLQGEVFSKLQYAHLIEFGSRSHIVRAKNKKRLRIQSDNGYVFPKEVSIPAQSGKPFLKPSYEAEEQNIINAVMKAVEGK